MKKRHEDRLRRLDEFLSSEPTEDDIARFVAELIGDGDVVGRLPPRMTAEQAIERLRGLR